MPENILVIEREPRDADLVRHALAGQPFTPIFASTGEEALRAISTQAPRLIVLGSDELIPLIRQQANHVPILLTGSVSREEAVTLGASDVLPKPISERDFLDKVRALIKPAGRLTSNDIFGDLLEDDRAPQAGVKKAMNATEALDKLLADTLSDVMPQKGLKPKAMPGTSLDKKLQDTLSGLEKSARAKTSGGTTPRPPMPAPASQSLADEKTHISEPLFIPPPPGPEEEEPTDGVKFGQYVLLEKIATGGMAEVWKARMRGVEGFQKIVAIKKILPHLSDNQEFIEMFVDEAKLAAQLNHNNIIHIYDLGKIQSSYYIAMEYVDGGDLKTILKMAHERDQPLGIELAMFITTKIAAALDYAHRKRDFEDREMGLVHRDVSPQNVLISVEGDIKLCDFGIAKAASKASQTQAGALKGKLQYMSPEQAWGKPIDRRSDVFALAAVLFEMLTQRKLFTGDNEMSILEQVREARVVKPSEFNDEVPPEIDAIVVKALQKDAATRYQSAAEMAKDIDSLLYTFRPTPTSADLAIYMHRLRAAARVADMPTMIFDEPPPPPPAPAVERVEAKTVAVPVAARATAMPSWEAPRNVPPVLSTPQKKKRSMAIPMIIVALIAVGGAGGYIYVRGRGTTTPATGQVAGAAATPVKSAPPPAASVGTVVEGPTDTSATSALATTTDVQPILDRAMVNEEVQRRLAAERARLEQQSRVQQPAPVQPAAVATQRNVPAPQPQPQPSAPQPAAAKPVVVENRPAPTPPVEEARPAPTPQPAATEPVRAREGELVTDLEGLTPARMVRRASVPYPPMARMQRVQGTVLVSVLVSETGAVLETRVIKPVNRPVGLNEAAEMIVRRSTFSAPMKDGVRVKAWTTVPIDFKL